MPRKSNSTTAREAAARVRSLIDECEARGVMLPVKNGALWHAEIKRQAKLSNGQIDGNDAIRQMLVDYADKNGIAFSRRGRVAPEEDVIVLPDELEEFVPTSRLREVQLRLTQAERRNAELNELPPNADTSGPAHQNFTIGLLSRAKCRFSTYRKQARQGTR